MFNDEKQQFYETYYAVAQAVVRRILLGYGQKEDVEECLQDVMYTVMSHPERFDETRGSMTTYVRVIARSRALYYRKKLVGHAAISYEEEIWVECRQEDELEYRELIKEILGHLKEKERLLFTMRYLYEMSTAEIAEKLSIKENTADARLTRLRKKLRKALKKEAYWRDQKGGGCYAGEEATDGFIR